MPSNGAKGGSIETRDVRTISYFPDNIVAADEIRKEHDIGGKNMLLVCRHCFDMNVELPTSSRRSNLHQKQVQTIATLKRQVAKHSSNGRKKVMC